MPPPGMVRVEFLKRGDYMEVIRALYASFLFALGSILIVASIIQGAFRLVMALFLLFIIFSFFGTIIL